MSPKLKPGLVLAVIFIAGALSGAALTLALAPHVLRHLHPHDPSHMKSDIMAGLTRDLNLTPDQQAKIEPIIGEAARELEEVHHDEVQRVSHIISLANDQMTPILTPDQKAQLDKLKAEGGAGMFFGHPHGFGQPGFHDAGPPPPPGPAPAPPPAQ